MITTVEITEFIGFAIGSFSVGFCSTYLLLVFKKMVGVIFS